MKSFVQAQHEANLERLRPLLEEEMRNVSGGGCSAEDPGGPSFFVTIVMIDGPHELDCNKWDC